MAVFDFVSGEDFRNSLESDYRELTTSINNGAWKAAQVLAGSIIEAILADYLVATEYSKKKHKDPLKMDLSELIVACREEGILTQRSADLSTVVREYRNLIHPGRIVRLQETVDENAATVARSLVEMIVAEVAKQRQQKFGLTAEQLLKKISQDSSAVAIFGHLLADMQASELELLLFTIPQRYIAWLNDDSATFSRGLSVLPQYFRLAFDHASTELKTKVAKHFVTILKEESEMFINHYEQEFFRNDDISLLSPNDAALVVEHRVLPMESRNDMGVDDYLKEVKGIGPYLTEKTVNTFVDEGVRTLVREFKDSGNSQSACWTLSAEYDVAKPEIRKAIRERVDEWIKLYQSKNATDAGRIAQELRDMCELHDDVPF